MKGKLPNIILFMTDSSASIRSFEWPLEEKNHEHFDAVKWQEASWRNERIEG